MKPSTDGVLAAMRAADKRAHKRFTTIKIGLVIAEEEAEALASEACTDGWDLVSIAYTASEESSTGFFYAITLRAVRPGYEPLPPLPKRWPL